MERIIDIPQRFRHLGWLLLAAACNGPEPPDQPNVLIFMVDTLRADHVSAYGYPKNTTPHMDAFAREGILFEDASAPSPQTSPSHASLFTSTWPATHGVWNQVKLESGDTIHPALAQEAVTLAETLRDQGWDTAAVCDGGWLNAQRGFDQGFDFFHSRTGGARDRVTEGLRWLNGRDESKPFFLFLHTYQVHSPNLPPVGYEDRFDPDYDGPLRDAIASARKMTSEEGRPFIDAQREILDPLMDSLGKRDIEFLRALYDGDLTVVDEEFARVMAWLRTNNQLDNTLVILTSDHGEEFYEHGQWGHHQIYEECLHIPLLVGGLSAPRGVRRSDPVELVDLMPSILGAMDVSIPASVVGRDIGLLSTQAATPPAFRVAQINQPVAMTSLRRGNTKALWTATQEGARKELFSLGRDPSESDPGKPDPTDDALLQEWLSQAAAWRERFQLAPTVFHLSDMSADQRAELQGLGYVDG